MIFRRFAVYDPGPAALADFGADWLGWDALAGRERAALGGGLTDTPRRYGFHATIKAPFRLADEQSLGALEGAFDTLAAGLAPVALPRLTLTDAGGFFSLRPIPQPPALTALAAQVVEALDPFRAPLTADEIARRNPDRLNEAQRGNLARWGYPHVMDQFTYHMTLTGPLVGADAAAVQADLAARLDGLLPAPHPLTDLALMGEDADGRFRLIRRAALG